MIEKMKFMSIIGPKKDIDRVTVRYLSGYEIHLENALTEFNTEKTLTPYVEKNPYTDKISSIDKIIRFLPERFRSGKYPDIENENMSPDDAYRLIADLREPLEKLRDEKEEYEKRRKHYINIRDTAAPFRDLPISFSKLKNFRFIRARFGCIPTEYFHKFETFVYEENDTIFYQCSKDNQYVWGVYFTLSENAEGNDDIYRSFHFIRTDIPDEMEGTPEEEYNDNSWKIEEMDVRIKRVDKDIASLLNGHEESLLRAREFLEKYSRCFEIRKYAACTQAGGKPFYVLCGWMSEQDAESFQRDIENDIDVFCTINDTDADPDTVPPTKLRNPKPFRPFEMFVRMYGLPKYNEFDPTIYVALTYSFLFGIMFGDVGQGLCFVIGGFLIYHYKHKDLAAILGSAGIFSVIWGLVYNSFFGFEGFFPYTALIRPKDDMITLPGLGTMNTVFVLSVAFGMIMILLNMVMGIVNAVRQKNRENIWFSQNALAGIIFYGTIVLMMFLTMSGTMTLSKMVPIILIPLLVSLAAIFLKEMLGRIVSRQKPAIEGSKGMYFVQAFFETLLTYLSNTLSYVRVGAYAVSHVAMMQVVMMLTGFDSGFGSIPGLIVGEIFVMAMEGLMVAIQVLRLEYYEMFSRFYQGGGREFVPFQTDEKSGS
jgi:V/A-type H+-transporting ATPase subunit I